LLNLICLNFKRFIGLGVREFSYEWKLKVSGLHVRDVLHKD
jgi:hypothetical protein